MATPLRPVPATLTDPDGTLLEGLFAGDVTADPVRSAPRGGRLRRWSYAAAGDATTVVGAAVVHLGFVGVVFAFAAVGGRSVTFDARRPFGVGVEVGTLPANGAAARTRGAAVEISGDGSLVIDVPTAAGRLRASVQVRTPVTPAVCATATAGGGWNVTRKIAGSAVTGSVQIGAAAPVVLGPGAGGWGDWTTGRQDRRTVWRWAAGAGTDATGRAVGVNASTGMNDAAGEDVVWWEGVPHELDVAELAPVGDDPERDWRVVGSAVDLRLAPRGVRAAVEQLPLLTSNYVQPFGTWTGAITDPDGQIQDVTMAGVAEDHLAVW